MKVANNQAGVGHLVAILAVVVIGAVGFIGYRVATMEDSGETSTQSVQSTTQSEVTTKADVEQASQDIDATSLDEVDPAQLDSDLNSIL